MFGKNKIFVPLTVHGSSDVPTTAQKDPVQVQNPELESVTKSLYKQNLELAVKNKTLSILEQLYEISIQTLTPHELAQKITEIIQRAFEFERVGIVSYDYSTNTYSVIAFSESGRFHAAREGASALFEGTDMRDASEMPLISAAIHTKEMAYSENLEEVWGTMLSKLDIQHIQEEGHVRSMIAYPLVIENTVMGLFMLTLNRTYEDLVDYEKESIKSFINVISVALDKARLYEALTVSNKKLEDANKQQVVLIHFITHQIKGFVAKSRNIFSMMLDGDLGQLPESLRPMAEEGFRSDTQGATTIQEILNAANIKSGAVTYVMAPFDFGALVNEITENLRPNADKKKLEFTVDLSGGPFVITGDRMQLTNAIKNIIDNAIKYTPAGNVTVKVERDSDIIRLTEHDTGVGISPEDMQHLFTEGGHGKESIKVNVESTGFGLYIVKNIIDAHHGKVWGESEGVGKGSKFTIELPATQTSAETGA